MAEAVVEFDYDAEQEDELTLRVGDVIKGVVTAEGGWWEGELNGKKGMFPENFVKLKSKESKKEEKREATQRKSVRELANKFKDGVPLPGSQGSVIHKKKDSVKKKCKVMFDYKPENEDELELQVGQTIDFIREVEEGWWEGIINGKTGVFPSNFVEMDESGESGEAEGGKATGNDDKDKNFQEIKGKKIMGIGLGNIFEGGPIKLRNTTKKAPTPGGTSDQDGSGPAKAPDVTKREKPNAKPATEKAIVRFSYAAEQPDELSLKEGEIIIVLDKRLEDEGWWKGEVNGKVGVFPDNFVELIPPQEETSKAPKKPPPPTGKNLYPKLQEKPVEEKTASTKKEQEVATNKQAAPVAAVKKPLAPPPVGKKPGGPGQPPGKPEPPKPVAAAAETVKVEMRNKESNNLQIPVPTDANKVQDQEDGSFDSLESSSQKLVHLTASRAKGPKKRPPSTVLFPTDVDKGGSDGDEGKESRINHVQPEKPPPPVAVTLVKDQKQTISMDVDRKHETHAGKDLHHDRNSVAPPRPPDPTKHPEVPSDTSAQLQRLVEDLQREVRDLRMTTVSKNEYNDLRSEYLRLKQDFEAFKTGHSKKLRDLMLEVDEEKKLRLNTQVEMERVKKLMAETHV